MSDVIVIENRLLAHNLLAKQHQNFYQDIIHTLKTVIFHRKNVLTYYRYLSVWIIIVETMTNSHTHMSVFLWRRFVLISFFLGNPSKWRLHDFTVCFEDCHVSICPGRVVVLCNARSTRKPRMASFGKVHINHF